MFKAHLAKLGCLRDLIENSLISGCGWCTYLFGVAEIVSGSRFKPNEQRELKLGHV